jgi:uncharacterized SAM-binding protein YcdF (DUF218 family)
VTDEAPSSVEGESLDGDPTPGRGVSSLLIDPSAIDTTADGSEMSDVETSADGLPPPSPRPRRRWLRFVLAASLLSIGYYGINLFQVWHTARSDQARPVDAIIVMGAAQYDGRPSPQLQARLDHVVELWESGLAPLIVVTGGNQPGDRFTEASASAAYLEDHGVDPDAILQENKGHSSWESLRSVATILHARDVHTVLLVSDPYHSLRIRLMAEDLGFAAYVSPTRTSPVQGFAAFGKEIKEAGGVAVGRIIGFGRLLSITG